MLQNCALQVTGASNVSNLDVTHTAQVFHLVDRLINDGRHITRHVHVHCGLAMHIARTFQLAHITNFQLLHKLFFLVAKPLLQLAVIHCRRVVLVKVGVHNESMIPHAECLAEVLAVVRVNFEV